LWKVPLFVISLYKVNPVFMVKRMFSTELIYDSRYRLISETKA